MDRDTFILAVSCLVVEHYHALTAHRPIRHGGFPSTLSDAEVLTRAICGEYFTLSTDKDLWQYFRTPSRPFFPALGDRTLCVRQAATLWQVTAAIQQRLPHVSGHATAPLQPLDTLPLPGCVYPRSRRARCLQPCADYGYCAAKDLHYAGCKLGLRSSHIGLITQYPLWAARPHDLNHREALLEDVSGLAPADKGFIEAQRQALLAERHGLQVVTPPRPRRQPASPRAVRKAWGRWRTLIETVGAHLTERCAIERIRVHDLWPYPHRLLRKVLAPTVAVFLNLPMGRQPLD
jgi:hypothetical protein